MPQESRVKKSLLNARVNLIFYFLTLALSFFSRKIFLDCLGADFVGLTGTLQNLLCFLNLAELGIGSAIGYVLYKPLFDHDEAKINEIISVFGYLYRWIGRIILGAGCILACFLPLIFPDTQFELGIIFFAYFAFLASSLIGYFANYKQTLLGADQKNYVITAYFQTATIAKTLIQMVSAYYTGSYYLWVVIELAFGIIYSFILNWKINQVYPWLRSEVKQGKLLFKKYPEVMKYTKQLFVHQISSFFQFQTTPFFVYTFVSLQTVAFYGNYTIITDKIFQLINTVMGSTMAGVGNLIAEGNNTKIKNVFWELMFIRFWIAGAIVFCLYFLLEPFIVLWIGKIYLLPKIILILILIRILLQLTSDTLGEFIYGYGLFSDVWAPVVQCILFVTVAIIGGFYLGLKGILLAPIISFFIIRGIWKPYFLYKKGFKLPVWMYWINYIKYLCILLLSFYISYIIISHIMNSNSNFDFIELILYALSNFVCYSVISTILYLVFTQSARSVITRFLFKIK